MRVQSLRTTMAIALSLTGACGSDAPPGGPSGALGSTTGNQATGSATGTAGATATAAATASGAKTGAAVTPAGVGTAGVATKPKDSGAAGSAAAVMPTRAGVAGAAGMPSADKPSVSMAGGAGSAGVDAGSQAGAAVPVGQTGTLPVPSALDQPGPFKILDKSDTGPGNQYRLFAPQPLGQDGVKHPIVAWSPGAGAFPEAYLTFLNLLASQGFVTLSFNSTAEGPDLVAAIDWLIAENDRKDSVLYGKLDTTKVAAGGHSAGSLATYAMADDPRLTTTLHMSGGSFMPETDVPKLHHPALMVCGDPGGDGLTTGDLANPNCVADFNMATVPVFFAVVKGAGHTCLNDAEPTLGAGTAPDDPHKLLFFKATIGWLRWQLAGDLSLKKMFVGDDCELCAPDSGYDVKQKNLN